jgi:hypothetical protein
MIRPAFGKGEKGDTVTAVRNEPKEITQPVYPNPNNGTFFLPISTEHLQIFDMTGRLVEHHEYPEGDQKRIEMQSTIRGIYILKIFKREAIYTQKILVQD